MPIIPTINESIKLGLNFTAAAPPILVAGLKTLAQVVMSVTGLQPMGPVPIPVIPFGAAISLVIQIIEYLINFFFELIAKIIAKMVALYAKQLSKAKKQRTAALKKLYTDEKEAQKIWREKLKWDENRIPDIIVEMEELAIFQEKELTAYMEQVMEYIVKARTEFDAGNEEKSKYWESMIASLEDWLVATLLITVEIMNKKLEMWELEREIVKITPICLLEIEKVWEWVEEHADDFEVPVPYYPDLPDRPSLPTLPVLPKGNCITDKLKQMLGKWLTAPQVPPIGLAIGGILECVRALMAPLPPPVAAKMEGLTDSIVTQMGMII